MTIDVEAPVDPSNVPLQSSCLPAHCATAAAAATAAEIESYQDSLQRAIAEIRRIRATEEARLAQRTAEATEAFNAQLKQLQDKFNDDVSVRNAPTRCSHIYRMIFSI